MSSSRSLPEAVRGCWYLVPTEYDLSKGVEGSYQVYTFGLDGSFRRHQVKSGRLKQAESGDYTFDGNFLILRGRQTETYRVRRPLEWRWELEGKNKDQYLMRALVDEAGFTELDEGAGRSLRILPLRAQVEQDFEEGPPMYRVVYRGDEGGDAVLLGTFFVEDHPDGRRWIGLTPMASGLEESTWERIISDSFLDMYCGRPDGVAVVTIRFLNSDASRVFNYRMKK